MARTPIYAAGGIVLRGRARPLVAVVQRSKDDAWVLPRGKLKRDENPVAGARREVVEETGHRVRVHEFLGAIIYRARGRPKVVQFWRMQAYERPSRDVMKDIIAVDWLPVGQAVRRLSYPLEKLFLQHAGRRVLKHRKHGKRRKTRARAISKPARRKARPPQAHRRTAKARAHKAATRAGKSGTHVRKARAHDRRSGSHGRKGAVTTAKNPTMLQRVLGRLGG
jgi:8-oxo-dGTP diphosphatase